MVHWPSSAGIEAVAPVAPATAACRGADGAGGLRSQPWSRNPPARAAIAARTVGLRKSLPKTARPEAAAERTFTWRRNTGTAGEFRLLHGNWAALQADGSGDGIGA